MHLCQCTNPQRIYNKYAREFQYVPCGKCDACRNARAMYWTQRLHLECKCWKYRAFVTLTYAPDKMPVFTISKDGNYLCGSPRAFNPDESVPIYHMSELYLEDNSSDEYKKRNDNWLKQVQSAGAPIGHLSRYHCQLFIKRLRKILRQYAQQSNSKNILQDSLCRYFLCGEYGSTTFRPHYHCLFFFNSELEASYFSKAIYKAWQYGITDCSFVSGDNSSYVASYVNSISHLPLLLQQRQVRAFFLCSKAPTIGSLYFHDEKIREIFYSSSPTFVMPKNDGKTFVDVPIWRSFKDSLFPKLALFDKFSSYDRVKLYRAVQRFEEFSGKESCVTSFVNYCKYMIRNGFLNRFWLELYRDYVLAFYSYGFDESNLDDFLVRWYYISKRVMVGSCALCISIDNYVHHIEEFYFNCKRLQLKNYFQFQEDYSAEYGSKTLVGCDLEFFSSLSNLDILDVSLEDLQLLKYFGVDTEKFFSDDLSIRLRYIEELTPQNQKDFLEWFNKNKCDSRNRTKNKFKNDYLNAQGDPALQALASFLNNN